MQRSRSSARLTDSLPTCPGKSARSFGKRLKRYRQKLSATYFPSQRALRKHYLSPFYVQVLMRLGSAARRPTHNYFSRLVEQCVFNAFGGAPAGTYTLTVTSASASSTNPNQTVNLSLKVN